MHLAEWDVRYNSFYSDSLFANPFTDLSSAYMPRTINSALKWCEYIFMTNGTYRQAVDRILSYFITDVEISGDDDDEKYKWQEYLDETIDVKQLLHTLGSDLMCMPGDVRVVTDRGPVCLKDLVGEKFKVLTKDGTYRDAHCYCYGKQKLTQLHFSSGRSVLATANHLWFMKEVASFREKVVKTTDLKIHDLIPFATAKEKNWDVSEWGPAVCHGFWFAKNCLKLEQGTFFCEVPKSFHEVVYYFEKYGGAIYEVSPTDNCFIVRLKNINYTEHQKLPEDRAPASYWLGFMRGFFAATFFAHTKDFVVLAFPSLEILQKIYEQLPRIGWLAYSVRKNGYLGDDIYLSPNLKDLSFLNLITSYLYPEDVLIESHRKVLSVNSESPNFLWQYDSISGIVHTDRVELVYCISEPVTHSFVLSSGLVTHNCYGNSFISVFPKFRRYLVCPTDNCGLMMPIKEVYENREFNFSWKNFEFNATCPRCKKRSNWKREDLRIEDKENIRIKRWSPHEIDIVWDLLTEDVSYVWKIPEHYRRSIREGKLHYLERVNWEVVECVKQNKHLIFEPDEIFHMRDQTLAGVQNRGWGISRVLVNFRQAWYVQLLHRYNESIAMDYVIPFRLITPAPGNPGTGSDPLLNQNLGGFMGKVRSMLAYRRRDPAAWHTLPFPVQYQVLGGEARQLAPQDLIAQAQENLLSSIGIPTELYRGTLQLQSAPASLRMFEASMSSIPRNLNRVLRYIVRKISQILVWEAVNVKLARVTHADDLQRQQTKLQLMMGGQVSPSTGLRSVGLDYREEVRRSLDDQRFAAETQAELEADLQQRGQLSSMIPQPGSAAASSMMGGGVPGFPPGAAGVAPGMAPGAAAGGGGMPSDAGGSPLMGAYQDVLAQYVPPPNIPITPEDLQNRAQALAQQIMGMPESEKDSTLIRLSKQSPTLHAVVSRIIRDWRRQAQRQGGAMLLSQQFGRQF